ncbi:MAG TPA: hypothetical protein VFK05_28670 [Polyangiaceae bacterium]|nr:hypothetical protein [Polyangiaceae bacterium]
MLIGACACGRRGVAPSQQKNSPDAESSPITDSANVTIAASAASPAPMPPLRTEQRFPLRNGGTAVVDQDDHVLLLAADGGVTAESSCGVNGIAYRRAVTFFSEVVRLIGASDKNALADLMSFPLSASVAVNSRAEFLRHYPRIFPPAEVTAISAADPAAIFCRNGAFMLGDGLIWAQADETGAYRMTTINRAFHEPSR